MSDINRYDIDSYCPNCDMEHVIDGEYVRYDDIKHLLNATNKLPIYELDLDIVAPLDTKKTKTIIIGENNEYI